MAFLAGDPITAARLNRLAPKSYYANATGTVAASQTSVTVPGCSITFTTETAGATVVIRWDATFVASGATGTGSCRGVLNGSGAPLFAVSQAATSGERDTVGLTWQTTIAAAGSNTVILQATTTANQTMPNYAAISVTVYEVA